MTHLLVETGTGTRAEGFLRDALALARAGRPVSVFLTADAAATGVRGASTVLAELVAAGGVVRVDAFNLAQRALTDVPLAAGVEAVDVDWLADRVLTEGTTLVWH